MALVLSLYEELLNFCSRTFTSEILEGEVDSNAVLKVELGGGSNGMNSALAA
jgi:hypothetical protein